MIRVAIIDSGVNNAHPHVRPISGGVFVTADGEQSDYTDYLGHGTAVAGAIREKSSAVLIYAVKVFDRQLATSGVALLRALDWCLRHQMEYINLSLGTLNESYRAEFEGRVEQARKIGSNIVAAYEMEGQLALPGSLDGVSGVLLDNGCPRGEYRREVRNGRIVFKAAGYPRDIPGVPTRFNLGGISFAVANVTGLLAAEAAQRAGLQDTREVCL